LASEQGHNQNEADAQSLHFGTSTLGGNRIVRRYQPAIPISLSFIVRRLADILNKRSPEALLRSNASLGPPLAADGPACERQLLGHGPANRQLPPLGLD
jgi:hypothetical protein